MTTAIEEKETMSEMPQVGKIVKESDYGCQILQEKTTLEKANDRSLPTDAKLIWYVVDGVEYIDLTRLKGPWGLMGDCLQGVPMSRGNMGWAPACPLPPPMGP